MVYNKKGLSNIVATVLIVLLALAAVAIIWTFIRGMINNTSCSASLQSECLNAEVKATACTVTLKFTDNCLAANGGTTGGFDASCPGPGGSADVLSGGVPTAVIAGQTSRGSPKTFVAILTDNTGTTYVSPSATANDAVLGTTDASPDFKGALSSAMNSKTFSASIATTVNTAECGSQTCSVVPQNFNCNIAHVVG